MTRGMIMGEALRLARLKGLKTMTPHEATEWADVQFQRIAGHESSAREALGAATVGLDRLVELGRAWHACEDPHALVPGAENSAARREEYRAAWRRRIETAHDAILFDVQQITRNIHALWALTNTPSLGHAGRPVVDALAAEAGAAYMRVVHVCREADALAAEALDLAEELDTLNDDLQRSPDHDAR